MLRATQTPEPASHQPPFWLGPPWNILAKLGVAGRVEAAAVAHRLGLD